jgi:hypothetical protein
MKLVTYLVCCLTEAGRSYINHSQQEPILWKTAISLRKFTDDGLKAMGQRLNYSTNYSKT